MERIFKRKLYARLLEWKRVQNGKTAILIEGARRVGKSTLVEQFAKNEYESYILIDFNETSEEVKSLFNNLMNKDFIFLQLQALYNVVLKERKSVIIFDEVQKCPLARQAIKYLVKDGRYDYIETGSLISIKKNTKDITIPSEEERLTMYPMDYEEFRWALGDETTTSLLRTFYEKRLPLDKAHRNAMRDFRLYMLVGGMPQAVNTYIETNNFSLVDHAKRGIIQVYKDDFQKLDESGRLETLFMQIPSQLNQTNNRYKPYNVLGDVDDDKLLELLKNLEDSKTTLFSYHSNDPNVGMSLTKNVSKFKIFCADTGIFVTLAFWDKDHTENIIYKKLLNDKLNTNLGYVYENVIAQMLAANGNKLFYYTWPKDKSHNYEIDFLLSRGTKLHPIEVKSSGYKAHKSLDVFCQKFSHIIERRYLIYTKDLKKENETLLLPVYMTPFL
ncbi:ATP-binding protein [Pseudoprevotella muciniphila]|uniref:ATP-binding protein n=1 Tax=Pseudoprevotella muciniphila TaxID=2133944 RepID=A0A5P8E6R5_9BACT|nr:AAA family ATPase [Pseudoprevotella muciniphila]QFQ12739.1 ATP-binding protein [Pseudoprevotella muciniphila]